MLRNAEASVLLREGLHGLRSDAAQMLRAICLGALHGPLSKSPDQRGYFSNQMPRTFASKPDYSVRFWRERESQALCRGRNPGHQAAGDKA